MSHSNLELRSTVTSDGTLRITLDPVPVRAPEAGELLVRLEAAPINPSDLGLLYGPADMQTLTVEGSGEARALTAKIPQAAMAPLAARFDQSMPVGNEGAGLVIEAGPDLGDMVGKRVAMIGGAMYAQLRLIRAESCIVLPEGATSAQGASLFVNPLTALGFTETMRAEGHSAIVHAPGASNLGQMLVRICQEDGIGLVSIVRSRQQADLLREIGATHVVDSSADDFRQQLEQAIAETGATIGFDAIGGGRDDQHDAERDGGRRGPVHGQLQPLWFAVRETGLYLWRAGYRAHDPQARFRLCLEYRRLASVQLSRQCRSLGRRADAPACR